MAERTCEQPDYTLSLGPLPRVLIRAVCRGGNASGPCSTLFFLPAALWGRVLKSDRRGRGPASSRGNVGTLARRRFAPSMLLALAVEVAAALPPRAVAERKSAREPAGSGSPGERGALGRTRARWRVPLRALAPRLSAVSRQEGTQTVAIGSGPSRTVSGCTPLGAAE